MIQSSDLSRGLADARRIETEQAVERAHLHLDADARTARRSRRAPIVVLVLTVAWVAFLVAFGIALL